MSRRSVFLIAATVIVLYFSLILFMLTPLHGARSVYFRNNVINHLSYKQVPSINWCKQLRWRSPPATDVIALVSFPGSGNTWLRYLLQQATGIVTGSIYMDYSLRNHGFPAENVTDGSVLVVKTHEAPPFERDKFKAAILLIRNPRDAILADFNRLHKGHIGTAPKTAFKKTAKYTKMSEDSMSSFRGIDARRNNNILFVDWAEYVSNQLNVWGSLHRLWLLKYPGPVHVVSYETLVNDTKNILYSILTFLNQTVSEEDMNCTINNKEGIYRRKKKLQDFDPFTSKMYKEINAVRENVFHLLKQHELRLNKTK